MIGWPEHIIWKAYHYSASSYHQGTVDTKRKDCVLYSQPMDVEGWDWFLLAFVWLVGTYRIQWKQCFNACELKDPETGRILTYFCTSWSHKTHEGNQTVVHTSSCNVIQGCTKTTVHDLCWCYEIVVTRLYLDVRTSAHQEIGSDREENVSILWIVCDSSRDGRVRQTNADILYSEQFTYLYRPI